MLEERAGTLGGEGKTVEVDGGYFGGYVKPANMKDNRRDRRLARNQNGKRKAVVIVRERGGNSVPAPYSLTQGSHPTLVKAMILMTDGIFNTAYHNTTARDQALALARTSLAHG